MRPAPAARASGGHPRWLVPVAALVGAVVVGLAGGLLLVQHDDREAQSVVSRPPSAVVTSPSPSGSPSTSPSASPSSTTSPRSTAAPATPATVEGVRFSLPAGWTAHEDVAGSACITRGTDPCDLRVVLPDRVRAAGGTLEDPQPDAALGWYLGSDVVMCGGTTAPSALVTSRFAPVGDRTAAYREWSVTCPSPSPYPAHPRLWWLPQTRLALLDSSLDAATSAVVDTLVRTAVLPPLPS